MSGMQEGGGRREEGGGRREETVFSARVCACVTQREIAMGGDKETKQVYSQCLLDAEHVRNGPDTVQKKARTRTRASAGPAHRHAEAR
jgi:hypothetical protein